MAKEIWYARVGTKLPFSRIHCPGMCVSTTFHQCIRNDCCRICTDAGQFLAYHCSVNRYYEPMLKLPTGASGFGCVQDKTPIRRVVVFSRQSPSVTLAIVCDSGCRRPHRTLTLRGMLLWMHSPEPPCGRSPSEESEEKRSQKSTAERRPPPPFNLAPSAP